jgi:DNA-binding beta-propeller fold protein YncE
VRRERVTRVALLTGAVAALLLAAAGPTRAQGAAKPEYSRRLDLPFRGDSLGFSRSVTADLATGEIFVCDWRYNRIAIFDERSLYRYLIHGGKMFSSPADIAVDPEGYLLILPSIGKSLVLMDFDGLFLEEFELHSFPVADLPDLKISSIALSPDGRRIFAVDQVNYRVWIADREGKVTGEINLGAERDERELRDLLIGHVDAYGDTLLVAVPSDGFVYLYDFDGRSQGQVGRKGTATCHTAFPVAAALDRDGNVVILDNQRALGMVWRRSDNTCLLQFSGFGNAPGAVYRPLDLTLDGEGRIYISQGFEGRVQMFDYGIPAAGSRATGNAAAGPSPFNPPAGQSPPPPPAD